MNALSVNESFLHYIWQFQYFDKKELKTTLGEEIVVLKTGLLNSDSGPDFGQSSLKINAIKGAGSVEVHIKSSGWYDHHHERDAAYENVILHVVWEDDKPVYRQDGTLLPTLVLRDRVDASMIHQYQKLISRAGGVACADSLSRVKEITRFSMIDRALMQRLETKAEIVKAMLTESKGDWEETTYHLLARNFGFKVNSDPFLQLARSLPYRIIRKHTDQPLQVEALLFGQAGFLVAKSKDEYLTALFNEYHFLAKKYSLQSSVHPAQWKFMRLRPVNFPTVRIAQFASLLTSQKSIFSRFLEATSAAALLKILQVTQSSYWKNHFRFSKKAKGEVPGLGEASQYNLVINTVAPLLVAYGKETDDSRHVEQAATLLQHIPAEENRITRQWKETGMVAKNAFDSQGLIELHTNFCQRRLCLSCSIGSFLLKPQHLSA